MTHPEPLPEDLAALKEQFPSWNFGTIWATAASSPDARRLTAMKDGILLSAWDAAALAGQIRLEESG
jgi:hypothetical protein